MRKIINKIQQFRSLGKSIEKLLEFLLSQVGSSVLSLWNVSDMNRKHLRDWEHKVTSQWGEDGIIDFITNDFRYLTSEFMKLDQEILSNVIQGSPRRN